MTKETFAAGFAHVGSLSRCLIGAIEQNRVNVNDNSNACAFPCVSLNSLENSQFGKTKDDSSHVLCTATFSFVVSAILKVRGLSSSRRHSVVL